MRIEKGLKRPLPRPFCSQSPIRCSTYRKYGVLFRIRTCLFSQFSGEYVIRTRRDSCTMESQFLKTPTEMKIVSKIGRSECHRWYRIHYAKVLKYRIVLFQKITIDTSSVGAFLVWPSSPYQTGYDLPPLPTPIEIPV